MDKQSYARLNGNAPPQMDGRLAPPTDRGQPIGRILYSMPPPPNGQLPMPQLQFSLNNFPPSNVAQSSSRPVVQDDNPHFTKDRFPGAHQQTIHGHGKLTWLSPRAGVIKCSDNKEISFQTKDFIELPDLTTVLRVGFILKFKATPSVNANQYMATHVAPIHGEEADRIFVNREEIDLEAHNPITPISRDQYSVALEQRAIDILLGAFVRHSAEPKIALGAIHNHMTTYNDDPIYRYVGTSSMKRRQFVQKRTHVFILRNDDTIELQHPAYYEAVVMLSSYLLRRGGVSATHDIYSYYKRSTDFDSIRYVVGSEQQDFTTLLTDHPFAFALFPNRNYVSARRNLPEFDYRGFIRANFEAMLRPPRLAYYDEQAYYHNGYRPEPQRRLVSNPFYAGPQYDQGYSNAHNASNVASWRVQSSSANGMNAQYNPYGEGSSSGYSAPVSQLQLNDSPALYVDEYSSSAFSTSSRTISDPNSKQDSPDSSRDMISAFDDLTVNGKSKNEQQPIGLPGCTCSCTCGRSRTGSIGAIGTKKAPAETKNNSVRLPTITPAVNNVGNRHGAIGTRPFSNSTASSSQEPAPSAESSYALFGNGNNNFLQGISFPYHKANNKK
ncbi:hypothetical protein CAEBREN_21780 [Caenorhabditis brenneri]|uniref:Lin-66-like winged helix domain-containing protein n=1 Tax=Caenorhabditis brenneri TaxID=135651 RepID=G0MDD4_CAEBE|nr:hypothetical protein CAEBREN_21780 [Caenorhabditis brenneri]